MHIEVTEDSVLETQIVFQLKRLSLAINVSL